MTLLPQVRAQLDAAAHRQVGRRRRVAVPALSRLRSIAPTIAVTVSVLAAVAIAVTAIVVLHRGHGRVSPAGRQGPAVTRVLGVLRRPQTAADRGFDARGWPQPPGSAVRPDRALVRLATITPWGAKVFVVPLAVPGNGRLGRQLGEGAPELGQTVALWVQGTGWSDMSTLADVEDGQAWGPQGSVPEPGGQPASRFFELVPDGVAKVTFYNAGFGTPITGSVTAVVHHNVAVFQDTGGARPVLARWFAADGHLIKRIGSWNLRAPALAAPKVRDVLGARGIGGVHFGASPSAVRAKVDALLGQTGPAYKRTGAECGIDHSITWWDDHTANGLPDLVAYFGRSRFVGYQYGEFGTMIPPHAPLQGVELATARGLRIGDTLARGRKLYRRAFALSAAQGGTWRLGTAGGAIRGYAWSRPGSRAVSRRSLVETIDAGDVGCPALSP